MSDQRILYLPIIEPGAFHDVAIRNKRGLYEALCPYGAVQQFDYLAHDGNLRDELWRQMKRFLPTLVLTQLHGPDCLTVADVRFLREQFPDAWWANWSGDSWLHSLTSPEMLELAQCYDLWMVAAPEVLPVYEEYYITAKFWQIAYEWPVDPLPTVPAYDVVFLGNVISDKRRALFEFLSGLDGVSVGIYGDWDKSQGQTTYDFATGEALYRAAKVAIADCAYPDQANYISNRPFQILMARGAVLLHEYVPWMRLLSGLNEDIHYLVWRDFTELERLIRKVVARPEAYRAMVETGYRYTRERHTYKARARQLLEEFL